MAEGAKTYGTAPEKTSVIADFKKNLGDAKALHESVATIGHDRTYALSGEGLLTDRAIAFEALTAPIEPPPPTSPMDEPQFYEELVH